MSRRPDLSSLSTLAGVPPVYGAFSKDESGRNRPFQRTSERFVADALDRMLGERQMCPPGFRRLRVTNGAGGWVHGPVGNDKAESLKRNVGNLSGKACGQRLRVRAQLLGPAGVRAGDREDARSREPVGPGFARGRRGDQGRPRRSEALDGRLSASFGRRDACASEAIANRSQPPERATRQGSGLRRRE